MGKIKRRGRPPAGKRWISIYLDSGVADALRRAAFRRRERGIAPASQGSLVESALRTCAEITAQNP